jgi:hypothetical protein
MEFAIQQKLALIAECIYQKIQKQQKEIFLGLYNGR